MSTGWAALARFGGFGDNLIVTTALPGLKAKYGHVEVITKQPAGVIFENNPYVDKVTYKGEKDMPHENAEAWQAWFEGRRGEYDFLVHLSHSCEFLRALFPGQTQFWWPASARRKFCGQNYLETVHDICELPYDPIGPGFFPTDEEDEKARQDKAEKIRNGRDGPVIGWVVSGSRLDKMHPRGAMAVTRLITELNATVALFGGFDKDRAIMADMEKHVRQAVGSLDGLKACIGKDDTETTWPIRRSLTQLQHCDLVITPDTGAAWAVAMCDMPKIVMVSHASAENITKYWRNTVTLHADADRDDVAIQAMWDRVDKTEVTMKVVEKFLQLGVPVGLIGNGSRHTDSSIISVEEFDSWLVEHPRRVPCWPCHRLHSDNSTCTPNVDNDGPACLSDISVEAIVKTARELLAEPR